MAKAFLFHHCKWWFIRPKGYNKKGAARHLARRSFFFTFTKISTRVAFLRYSSTSVQLSVGSNPLFENSFCG